MSKDDEENDLEARTRRRTLGDMSGALEGARPRVVEERTVRRGTRYVLIAGHRRVEAERVLGRATVLARIIEVAA